MARKTPKQTAEERDFIRGRTNSVQLSIEPNKALGYSPTQATASGAGHHGPKKKTRHKLDRSATKRQLRRGEFD